VQRIMFEQQQATVNQLLQSNARFRHLWDKHAALNARVDRVVSGDLPMEQIELENLKKEKLHVADQLHAILQHPEE
jgi:uncharacterized protein YdcH (DUF465 family)